MNKKYFSYIDTKIFVKLNKKETDLIAFHNYLGTFLNRFYLKLYMYFFETFYTEVYQL